MPTVTRIAEAFEQPYGGFLKPSWFDKRELSHGPCPYPYEDETIGPHTCGLAVDYLTRLILSKEKEKAFSISLRGAKIASSLFASLLDQAQEWLNGINGLDNQSIVNACKLVTFDVWYRAPSKALKCFWDYPLREPDKKTIANIRHMVESAILFAEEYGPIIDYEITFEPPDGDRSDFEKMMKTHEGHFGGYTSAVSAGDGDFLTKDTLWDFKASKKKINKVQTLQLLMYYIMGKHSGQKKYEPITQIGIYNPRKDTVFLLDALQIPKNVFRRVEKYVIEYSDEEIKRVNIRSDFKLK